MPLLRNNRSDIEALFREHYQHLCRVVYPVLKDQELARDVVQEVFLDLWKRKGPNKRPEAWPAYLYRAVMNKAFDHLRSRERRLRREDRAGQEQAQLATDTDQLVQEAELEQVTQAAIAQLPARCQLVFYLSRYEHLSNKEVAERLDLSVKTVENQLGKALKKLRKELLPYLEASMKMK